MLYVTQFHDFLTGFSRRLKMAGPTKRKVGAESQSGKAPKKAKTEQTEVTNFFLFCVAWNHSFPHPQKVSLWEPHVVLAGEHLNNNVSRSEAICKLLEDGCSIPFIARYRKAVTGNMMPDKLREIQDRYEDLK